MPPQNSPSFAPAVVSSGGVVGVQATRRKARARIDLRMEQSIEVKKVSAMFLSPFGCCYDSLDATHSSPHTRFCPHCLHAGALGSFAEPFLICK